MLKIFRQQLPVQLGAEQFRDLGTRLSDKYQPLISGIKREYWKKIGLQPSTADLWFLAGDTPSGAALAAGELYLVDPDTILYFKQPKDRQFLEAGAITRKDPSNYADFFITLREQVKAVAPEAAAEWEPLGKVPASLTSEDAAGTPPVRPSRQEVEAAEELEGEASRDGLGLIIQRNSIFLNKLIESRDKASIERMVGRFDKLGLISRDYAVLCSKTGQQILRVATREAIEEPSHKTFKCFVCGRPISEEIIDEIITATDFGKKLLDNDYWLLVRVVGAMQRLGLPEEDVTLRTDDSGLSNLFVLINQEAYLFVLANRKLGLNEAYVISAHVAAFDLDHVVVVSNERISNLMRYHLEKTNPTCTFDMVESLRGLEDRFENILREKEKRALRDTLDPFASLTPVRVQDLIMQRLSPDPSFAAERTAAAVAETSPPPRSSRSRKTSQAVAVPPPAAEAAPPEEESFFMEEVIPEDVAAEQ